MASTPLLTLRRSAGAEAGWRERLGALRHLPRFFGEIWRTSRALTSASIGLRLLRALQPAAVLYIGKLIVDEVVLQSRVAPVPSGLADWVGSGRLEHLGLLIASELALVAAGDLVGRATTLVDGILMELASNRLSVSLMRHATSLDLRQFEAPDTQDMLERARRQAGGRNTLVPQCFGQVQTLVTVAALAFGLLAYAPLLALLLFAALLPAVLAAAHFNTQSYRLTYAQATERRRLDYMRFMGASVDAAREVKLFGLGVFLTGRFETISAALQVANRRIAVRRAGWGSLFGTLTSTIYYVAYAVIVWRTVTGEFSLGDMTFLAGSFLRLNGLFESLLTGVTQVSGQALFLDDLFSFFDLAPAITAPSAGATPFPQPIRGGIVFEDVGFRYPGTERWALRHLDLAIRAGEVVALVGENGAGKTTIVKLLTRLYDPDEGRILVDGIDLRSIDPAEIHRHVGVIFQDFVRYSLTAGENIGLGRVDAMADGERVAEAARGGLADAVIDRLPLGYEQPLGRLAAKGTELSGGEWQKIAIARAYMRDAEILVLDEPTAALDARAEAEVFGRFRRLAVGRTALLISHRFSTVRMADAIVVIEGGEILESGSHAALLEKGGRYAELFSLQAAGYR